MPDRFEVDLNRDGPHSIDVEAPSFTAEGRFDVVLRNHGKPLHVHVRLDGDLADVARVSTPNHYVEKEGVHTVGVRVAEDRLPVEGRLEIVSGYGAETAYVSTRVLEPGAVDTSVAVDERLGEPPTPSREPILDRGRLALFAISVIILSTGGAAVLLISDVVVLAFVLVALVGVATAAGLVLA